jgi:hypothetical protein
MVTMTRSAYRHGRSLAAALLVAAGLGLGVSSIAQAAPASYIDFELRPQGGSARISYQGGSTPLVGNNLGVADLKGFSTPVNDGVTLNLVQGELSFATGNFKGTSQNGTTWQFAPGGSLTITGAVPSLGITDPKTTLLTGSFLGPDTPPFVQGYTNLDLKTQGGAFFNVVNPALAAYFGLPTGGAASTGVLTTTFAAAATPPSGFSSNGFSSGDVTASAVPEPGALAIFGVLATAGVAYLHRQRARTA